MNKFDHLRLGINGDTYSYSDYYKLRLLALANKHESKYWNLASRSIQIYFQSSSVLNALLAESVKEIFPECRLQEVAVDWDHRFILAVDSGIDQRERMMIYTQSDDERFPEKRIFNGREDLDDTSSIREVDIKLFGEPERIDSLCDLIIEKVIKKNLTAPCTFVKWLFQEEHGVRSKVVKIQKTWEIHKEFYPAVNTELVDYYQKFKDSQSQILVLYGPPGTGKTSFIRDLLCSAKMNAIVTHDVEILKSDQTYVEFLTDPTYDAFVIEDADDLLTSDRSENNKIISKILNSSDGLVKLPSKKLIFTTNLSQASHIDQAVIRPGRCFDVLGFGDLTREQACFAGSKIGLTAENIANLEGSEISLADLFNLKNSMKNTDPLFANKHRATGKRIGF